MGTILPRGHHISKVLDMKRFFAFILLNIIILGISSSVVFAQEGKLALTITPPLIKINLSPGDIWSSSIKLVNNNPNDLQVYVQILDFKRGKEGGIEFIQEKDAEEGQGFLLSQWIETNSDPVSIPSHQGKEVPFTIRVPEGAEPGEHYVAILAGTKPIGTEVKGSGIRVSQLVSSLILANIQGKIIEKAKIKEFTTDKTLYQKPEVKFTVQIENTGSVRIQPRGEIRIYNLFGKERGVIPINQETDLGSISPHSTQKWTFIWQGEKSPFGAGRYKAELVMEYGNETKQTLSSTVHFWILPILPTLGIVGGIFLFFALAILMIRAYVRKSITLALPPIEPKPVIFPGAIIQAVANFSRAAIVDLREIVSPKKAAPPPSLIKKWWKPCLIILLFVWGMTMTFFYFKDLLGSGKTFEVIKQVEEEEIIVPLEQKEIEQAPEEEIQAINKAGFTIKILNGCGAPGMAAKTADRLENEGFRVTASGNADSFNYGKTLIIYKIGKEKEAEFLNQFFNEKALLFEVESQAEDVIITIGKDFCM